MGKTLFAETEDEQRPLPKKRGGPASRAVATRQAGAVQAREPTPVNMLALIAQMAANPRCNPEKMRALIDMQKELAVEEARRSFTAAFLNMHEKLPTINADGKIEIEAKAGSNKKRQSTPYATFHNLHQITTPILRQFGFVMSFAPDAMPDGRLIMRATLDHVDSGGFKTGMIVLPVETSGSKNNVQGVGSSISYGKRYLKVTMLNIITLAPEDKDDDGRAAGKMPGGSGTARRQPDTEEIHALTTKQVAELKKAIEDCGVGEDTFCNKYEIERVEELAPNMLGEALAACVGFKKRRDEAKVAQS